MGLACPSEGWEPKNGEIAKDFFTLSVFWQSFMEEMTRKQPDVDRVTKTYKRKATEPPHGPFIDKSRSNSASALGARVAGNAIPRKLISFDYQLTRHPALAATRKAAETCQEGRTRVAFPETAMLGVLFPGVLGPLTPLSLSAAASG